MSKKKNTPNGVSFSQIEKVIQTGSLKDKVRLFLRNHADRLPELGRKLLDPTTETMLVRSVRQEDWTEWCEQIEMGMRVEQAITLLHSQLMRVRSLINEESIYLFVWDYAENSEVLVNSILDTVTFGKEKGEETREYLLDRARVGVDFNLCKMKTDPDGFLEIDLKETTLPDTSLMEHLTTCHQLIEQNLVRFKVMERAIREVMKKTSLNLPEYTFLLDKYTEMVDFPFLFAPKYSGIMSEFIPNTGSWKTLINSTIKNGTSFPAMAELMKTYKFSVDYEKTHVDEEEILQFVDLIMR